MREMRIRKQIRLGFARTMEICVSGIYYRLFRSLITIAIVSVAIAFMMYMLSESIIGRSVHRYIRSEAQRYKTHDRWLSWTEESMGRHALFRILGQAPEGDPKIGAMKQWGALSDEQMNEVLAVAGEGERYLRFFENLSPGKRFLLLGDTGPQSPLDGLLAQNAFEQFANRLSISAVAGFPGSVDDLSALLDRYRGQMPLWASIEKGRGEALARLRKRYPGRKASDLLAAPPPDFSSVLAELGFSDPLADLSEVFKEATYERNLWQLSQLMRHSGFKRDISRRAAVESVMADMGTFAGVYLSRGGPAFTQRQLKRHGIELALDRETIRRVLESYLRRSRILRIESGTTGLLEGWLGFSNRTVWLIGVAFIVCIVGIANAMLMSVMERFREIATMKCLGATDSFVMALFVLESCMQGIVGGILGAVLGLLLAVPSAFFRYGNMVWGVLPMSDVLAATLIALATGVILAAIASVYPAYIAARLVPMEAMQVE